MAKLISSKMVGGANTRIQNAVSDLQDKYKDILKLEQVPFIINQNINCNVECGNSSSNVC